MSISARIVSPANNSAHQAGATITVEVEVEAQGSIDEGVASLQFSNHSSGPWTTCRPNGGGGVVTADAVPWSAQEALVAIEAQIKETVWIRFGVWPDQSLDGAPEADPSDPIRLMKITTHPGP